MALLSDKSKLAILVLVNIVFKNNCENVGQSLEELIRDGVRIDYEDIPNIDKKLETRTKVIEPVKNLESAYTKEDETNSSKDYIDTITSTTTTTTTETVLTTVPTEQEDSSNEENVEDYDSKNTNETAEQDNTDTVRTTAQDVTDMTYTMSIDNNIYSRDGTLGDIYNQSGLNAQSESATTATTRAMDSMEDISGPNADDYESSGQRNPKTEAERETIDKRVLDKPRPQVTLSKSSTLKSWLEDSWLRPPAGILVPLRPQALSRALGVWNDLAGEGLNLTDIVIVGYDTNGINWRSRHNLQPSNTGSGDRAVSEALSKLLLKYQGVYTDSTNDGTMRALASAAKLVPYDSALFLVTDKGAGDAQRLPLALRALVEKRLKVYTVWTDPNHPSMESELALQDLRNVSSHTEGEVLPYSLQIMDVDTNLASEAELQQWEPVESIETEAPSEPRRARINAQPDIDVFDTLLVRRGGGEAISLGVPVENGVTALRIFIEGAVEHAVLYPPNDGPQIDLYNQSSVRSFSPASRTENLSPRDVYLVFPGSTLNFDMLSVLPATLPNADASSLIGMWHLSVRCDTCDYRLKISARAQLHFHAEVEPKDMLKLRVTGTVASVRESLLVDEYGVELAKLPFSYQPMTDNDHDIDFPMADLFADVPLPDVSGSKAYVKIVGRDIKGEPFVRLEGPINQQAEIRMGRSATIVFPESWNDLELIEEIDSKIYNEKLQYNDSNILPFGRATSQVVNQRGSILTAVQIGLSSKLYGSPGERLQLHFEVTNFREQAVRFTFGAVGELRFLTGIDPTGQSVASGQTANVIVNLQISQNAQPGARDLVTFTAYGQEQVSISAYVYVINPGESISDIASPEVRHNFQGSCLGRMGNDCAEHVWSATVIARDPVGGLLRLSSSPLGLVYDSNFISGSRVEMVASYRATCCAPRVIINAVDAFGNANSYTVDISIGQHKDPRTEMKISVLIRDIDYITDAGIAAIALGVLLLVVLIILIILSIYCCVKKRKESRELPSYTTSRNIS